MGPLLLPKRAGTTNPTQCQEPLVQTLQELFCTDFGHIKGKGAGAVISATGRSELMQQSWGREELLHRRWLQLRDPQQGGGLQEPQVSFLGEKKTRLFLTFVPTVLTNTQQHLCCCLALTFALLPLRSWALQSQPNPRRPAFATRASSLQPSMRGQTSPVKATANSFTDYLDTETVFPPYMPLDYRARSHTWMECMGYKSLPHI